MQTEYQAGAKMRQWVRFRRMFGYALTSPDPSPQPHAGIREPAYMHKQQVAALPTARMTAPIPRAILEQAERAEARLRERDTDKTYVMPTITPHRAVTLPPYLEYRRPEESPCTLLYAASVAAVRTFDRLPDVLFISPWLEGPLGREYARMTGKVYDGHFRVFNPAVPGNIEVIPVFTEALLPDILRAAIGRPIGVDTVIVVQEG